MSVTSNILKSVMKRAETEDLTLLPLAERCSLIKEFSTALIAQADGSERAENNADPDDIDEQKFENEVRVLKRLAYTLSYSGTFHAWNNYKKRLLTEVLSAKHPPPRLCREWDRANLEERYGLVRRILNRQCDIFSEDLGFTIPAPELKWLTKGRQRTIGMVEFCDYQSLKEHKHPAALVRRHLFEADEPDQAITTAQHEALHIALYMLAMQLHDKAIERQHPLYDDAVLELEKIKANAIIPSRVYSAYRAQPEEKLCFGLEEYMQAQWLSRADEADLMQMP